jgi:hypothetical protein
MNIPKEDFVIYGSAPLVLRGLKEKNNDLDVLVKDSLWNKLAAQYKENVKGDYIDVDGVSFANCKNDFFGNIDNTLNKVDIIDGYRIMNLQETIKWKEKTGVEKHINDAKRIRDYLRSLENRLGQ